MNPNDGVYHKYNVTKREGPTDPNAYYFVLRIDTDAIARKALRVYAEDVGGKFGGELLEVLDEYERRALLNLVMRCGMIERPQTNAGAEHADP